jgi:translocation and assembly module TamB
MRKMLLFSVIFLLVLGFGIRFALNSPSGRTYITESLATLTGQKLTVTGWTGSFPEQIAIAQLVWQDDNGVLTLDGLQMAWQPWQLLAGVADIRVLQAERIGFVPSQTPRSDDASESTPLSLPVAIRLHTLHVGEIDLSAVTGQASRLSLDAQADWASINEGTLKVSVQPLQNTGTYELNAQITPAGLHAKLLVNEPAQGLLAVLAGLKESQPLNISASLDGPLTALQTALELNWGQLNAVLQGPLDAQSLTADWQISANAPAMRPHADLAWQSLALQGTVKGLLSQPSIHSALNLRNLQLNGPDIGQINLSVQGEGGLLDISGDLMNLRLNPAGADVLQGHPVTLQASVRLNEAQRPVSFKLTHPLFSVQGDAVTAGGAHAKMALVLPNLQTLTQPSGMPLSGNARLTLLLDPTATGQELKLDGALNVLGGDPRWLKLLGKQADLGVTLAMNGADLQLPRCQLQGKNLLFKAEGNLKNHTAKFNWQLDANDMSAFAEKATGKLTARGQLDGPLEDFSVLADVSGEVGIAPMPRKPVTVKLNMAHLPKQTSGQVTAKAMLAGAPLDLELVVKPQADQAIVLDISRAQWKSVRSQGKLTFAKNSPWPVGAVQVSAKRLDDLRPLLGQAVSGSLIANLKTSQPNHAVLALEADTLSFAGAALDHAALNLTVRDAINKPKLAGALNFAGLATGGITGSGNVDVNGTLEQLAMHWMAALENVVGAPMQINGNAAFASATQEIAINSLSALWKEQNLHLLAPVRVVLGDAVSVKNLQLGLGEAILQADGQFSPNLNMTAHLQHAPLSLLTLFNPDLQASGSVSAQAQLHGTAAKPIGTVQINGKDLRLLTSAGQALPAANLDASANLDGVLAQLQAKLKAGDNANLSLTGTAPLNAAGTFDLKTTGTLELKLLDPLLTADGRRVRGRVAINGSLLGTLEDPQVAGTVTLNKVEVRDYAMGLNLTAINGLLRAKGGELVIEKLQAQAGKGVLDVKGSIDVLKEGLPVNLSITARDAKPLASDRLTANLNADLTVRGMAVGELLVMGGIQINRADIRIPEYLPANIAVLKLRTPGEAPPPPPEDSKIKLNLIISAADEIFVRGRGVDAELDGSISVRGSTARPRAEGGFKLRRGQFTLGGKTLTFIQGKVGFDSGRLTDPSLNFIANSSSDNITATLTISGTANKPKISLSSVPDLPQDEVLARLLFSRSVSSLSVLEIVQIGSAVATLSGATSGFGDPLDSVRQTLGLDRLTVGGKKTSIEAGSYVAPGVYLGTRQGLTGGPQATIQVDLTKHLKLEAAVGAGSTSSKNANPNSLGVIYQFEY